MYLFFKRNAKPPMLNTNPVVAVSFGVQENQLQNSPNILANRCMSIAQSNPVTSENHTLKISNLTKKQNKTQI